MAARESQDLPRRIADLQGQDAYALLGVEPDAGSEEIAAAYRREMVRAHPDRGGSAHRAQALNCAFDVLTRHRDDYDELTGRSRYPARPDVLYVDPDVEPLDDVEPGRRGIRPRGLGLAAVGLAVVAVVAVAVVTIDRAGESPSGAPAAAWTTSGLGLASVAATTAAPEVGAGTSAVAVGSSVATVGSSVAMAGAAAGPTAGSAGPAAGSAGSTDPPASQTWSVPTPATAATAAAAATAVVVSASATGPDGGHRCEVRADGSLWCAGGNAHGQLGIGSTQDAVQPVRVGAQDRWSAVAVGGSATCGLHTDGALWCWGDNTFGQLGDGTNSARDTPVPVEPVARWLALDVDTHACAVRTDHTLWCWGAGGQGELGDVGVVDRATPVRIGGETAWAAVSVGAGWTCGVRQDGSSLCWGAPVRR